MAVLRLDHLYKAFDNVQILNDVLFEIDKKSFIVLAGPSGCGKTTLLEMIAGLQTTDKGRIIMNDTCVNDIPPEERRIAMVFQNAALFEHLSVYENIAIGLAYNGLPKEEISMLVHKYAKMVCIEDLLERKARNLSSGQKQRVSIARALVRNPKIVLMDEALNALDTRLKTQLRIEISQLYHQMNMTFIYVTHDQVEAMTLAEILIVMNEGSFQQIGKPMELYANPCNLFVANFVSKYEINQFHAVIVEQKLCYRNKELPMRNLITNQEIIIAIRPEHIFETTKNGFLGNVVLIENLGDEIFYHIAFDGSIIVMKGNIHQQMHLHEQIAFDFSFHDALYFDSKSNKRIYID